MVMPVGFSVDQVRVTDWPGWIEAGSALKSMMRAGSWPARWYDGAGAAPGGGPAGGACAIANRQPAQPLAGL